MTEVNLKSDSEDYWRMPKITARLSKITEDCLSIFEGYQSFRKSPEEFRRLPKIADQPFESLNASVNFFMYIIDK